MNLGGSPGPGYLDGGRLMVYAESPSPSLATPLTLRYEYDTRIESASSDTTTAGAPRNVTLFNRDGRQTTFSFNNGQSMGAPQGSQIAACSVPVE